MTFKSTNRAVEHGTRLCAALLAALTLGGCALPPRGDSSAMSIPCTYRFKMLSRPEDQSRVESAIRSVAVPGTLTKGGSNSYPEYRFRVARMADLDRLNPKLVFGSSSSLWHKRNRALNMRTAGVEFTFDSTDVSASAVTTVTFNVKPGSRLYYKDSGNREIDITSKVDSSGRVVLPLTLREGQKFVYARAIKGMVTRYIRINIFTNEVKDVSAGEY